MNLSMDKNSEVVQDDPTLESFRRKYSEAPPRNWIHDPTLLSSG